MQPYSKAVTALIVAAQLVCKDHDLICEDSNGNLERLQKALDELYQHTEADDGTR